MRALVAWEEYVVAKTPKTCNWPKKNPSRLIADMRDKAIGSEGSGRVDEADLLRQGADTIERLEAQLYGQKTRQ